MKRKPQLNLLMVLLVTLILVPQAKADAVSDWNLIAIQRIGAANPAHPAPVTFIDMAIVQAAVYDAVQNISRTHHPYHVVIPGASGSPDAAAAKAARDILIYLFPNQSADIAAIYDQYLLDHPALQGDPGAIVGTTAAAGIIALRANDGRFPPGQVPFSGGTAPGEWRPTESFQGAPPSPPSFSPMAAPWVANVRTFALKSRDQFRAGPPPPLGSNEYTNAYNEVKEKGARFNSTRTDDETKFALFFASNYVTMWNRLVRDLAASENLSVGDNARLCALVNFSMADAAITSWDSKVTYNFWRPLTAIRLGNSDLNPETVGDGLWEPLINTPNYPDHTSGANNVSGAASRSLALFFGTDAMSFVLRTTNMAVGVPPTRSYQRFSDTSEDVVTARIYEGIHFRFADEDARKQGRHVAQWVFGHVLKPLE